MRTDNLTNGERAAVASLLSWVKTHQVVRTAPGRLGLRITTLKPRGNA